MGGLEPKAEILKAETLKTEISRLRTRLRRAKEDRERLDIGGGGERKQRSEVRGQPPTREATAGRWLRAES